VSNRDLLQHISVWSKSHLNLLLTPTDIAWK